MNTERIIETLYLYQEIKNKLVLQETGIELIPDQVKLYAEDFEDEELIAYIVKNFTPTNILSRGNCIHCLIDDCNNGELITDQQCKDCKYKVELGMTCYAKMSLFHKISSRFETSEPLLMLGQGLKRELDKWKQ